MSTTKFSVSNEIYAKLYEHSKDINRQARLDQQKQNLLAPEFNVDFIGAFGEYIAAHYFKLEYCFNTKYERGRSDLTNGYEVRSTTCVTGNLITYDFDRTAKYILAVVNLQEMSVDLKGWLHSDECRQQKYWRNVPYVRKASYWVPQKDLKPMQELVTQ